MREVLARLLSDAGRDTVKWAEIVPLFNKLPDELFEVARNSLKEFISSLCRSEREQLGEPLARILGEYYGYPNASWSLTGDRVKHCEVIYTALEPRDVAEGAVWRFSRDLDLLRQQVRSDWELNFETRLAWHRKAAKEAYLRGGLDLIVRMVELGAPPGELGAGLAWAALSECEEWQLLGAALGQSGPLSELGLSFLYSATRRDASKLAAMREHPVFQGLSPAAMAEFARCLPLERSTWDWLDQLEPQVGQAYWQSVGLDFAKLAVEDEWFVAERLALNGRASTALKRVAHRSRWRKIDDKLVQLKTGKLVIDSEQLLTLLEALIRNPDYRKLKHPHYLRELIEMVPRKQRLLNRQRFEKVERSLLCFVDDGFLPVTLHDRLWDEPKFFAEQVMAADHEHRFTDGERTASALLDSFRFFRRARMRVDLSKWVQRARAHAQDERSLYLIDSQIGELLALAKQGEDGFWPDEKVRDVVEESASKSLEAGVLHQLQMSRGFTCRGVLDGGGIERKQEKEFRKASEALRAKWPRTALLLESIARRYSRDARHEDERAELHQALWQLS